MPHPVILEATVGIAIQVPGRGPNNMRWHQNIQNLKYEVAAGPMTPSQKQNPPETCVSGDQRAVT